MEIKGKKAHEIGNGFGNDCLGHNNAAGVDINESTE